MEKTIHSTAYKIIREWLVEVRQEKGLTQRDLASLLDVPHSWVGKVESCERRLDLIEFIRVCRKLEVNPHKGLDVALEQIEKEE